MEGRQFAEDLSDLDISIFPTGADAGLHFHNDPNDPYQRDTIVQRKGRVNIGCKHKDIAHGYFSEKINDLCTLIVVQFRFESNGLAARIKEAHAILTFAAMDVGNPDPEVVAMYPEGGFFVQPTVQHEQVLKGAEANVGGGAAGAQVGGVLKMESTVERETTDYTRVHGSIDVLRASDFGKPNAVSWDLFENATAKTGVVTNFQAAVLLKRKNMNPFKASITLKATADTTSRISTLFKKDEKDDDVWYDPKKPSTDKLLKYDTDNLGSVDLKSLSDVTFRTVLKDALKEI